MSSNWAAIHLLEQRHKHQIFLNTIFLLVGFSEQISQPLFGCTHVTLKHNTKTNIFEWVYGLNLSICLVYFLFSWVGTWMHHCTTGLWTCLPTVQVPSVAYLHVTNSSSTSTSQLGQNFLSKAQTPQPKPDKLPSLSIFRSPLLDLLHESRDFNVFPPWDSPGAKQGDVFQACGKFCTLMAMLGIFHLGHCPLGIEGCMASEWWVTT